MRVKKNEEKNIKLSQIMIYKGKVMPIFTTSSRKI